MNEKKFQYKKLVRDKLLEKFKKDEVIKYTSRKLEKDDHILELKKKIVEEANEILDAKDREELIIELADIFEVLESFIKIEKISKQDLIDAKVKKQKLNGSFLDGLYIEDVTIHEKHHYLPYFKNKPEKYPEIFNN